VSPAATARVSGSAATGAAALLRPVPRTSPLRLVPQRRSSAARAPFVAAVVGLLAVGLLGLLALNTALAQDAFRLHTLDKGGKVLTDRQQVLERQVEALRAPAGLAGRAAGLGMVPGGPPAFLRLSDGAVLGSPSAGKASPSPAASPAAAAGPAKAAGKPAAAGAATRPPAHKAAAAKPAATKPAATKPAAPKRAAGQPHATRPPARQAVPTPQATGGTR